MSSTIGIIGGSGFYSLDDGEAATSQEFCTPYSDLPVFLYHTEVNGKPVWFVPRHGIDHAVPPHLINFRANLWALKEAGVTQIVAVNAVGGISKKMEPGLLVIPDQIIDYTWGREHTFFGRLSHFNNHVDFTHPYNQHLSSVLYDSARALGFETRAGAVYACTQGPRLETAAEIQRLKKDGCDIVGMTGMPEAGLARELDIDYSCLALVVNWGAGLSGETLTVEAMKSVMDVGVGRIRKVIFCAIEKL